MFFRSQCEVRHSTSHLGAMMPVAANILRALANRRAEFLTITFPIYCSAAKLFHHGSAIAIGGIGFPYSIGSES